MLVTFGLGCSTWKSPQLAPEQVLASKRPDHVRVIQTSGAQLELWNPRVTNDSLVGTLERIGSTRFSGVPLADIREVAWRQRREDGTPRCGDWGDGPAGCGRGDGG